jgi:mono/diheme cytochrome c family protein
MNFTLLYQTHKISVIIFLLIYLIKTVLLLINNQGGLQKFTKIFKVPEMIVSALFLITGVWMFVDIGNIKTLQIVKLVAVALAIPLAVIGFKKANKGLAIAALLLIILSYGFAEMAKKKPYPVKATPSDVSDTGAAVYEANCAMCHGGNGKKGLNNAKDLSVSTLDKASIIEIVKNGKGTMPGYKDALSEKEVDAVADYVLTLKK